MAEFGLTPFVDYATGLDKHSNYKSHANDYVDEIDYKQSTNKFDDSLELGKAKYYGGVELSENDKVIAEGYGYAH